MGASDVPSAHHSPIKTIKVNTFFGIIYKYQRAEDIKK